MYAGTLPNSKAALCQMLGDPQRLVCVQGRCPPVQAVLEVYKQLLSEAK